MSHQSHESSPSGVVKNYTGTALTSFIMMFFLFLLLSRCHGNYHPANTNHHTQEHTEKLSAPKEASHH
jgi:hypothetical protein